MNREVSSFLATVCQEIKYKGVHKAISLELQNHLDEIILAYLQKGISEEEAVKKALYQMGDPVKIGKSLDQAHKPRTEGWLLALVATMIIIGFGVVNALSYVTGSYITSASLISYTMYLIVGLVVFIGCYFTDYTKLEKFSLPVFLSTVALLFYYIKKGTYIYGIPQITIGSLSFNPTFIFLPIFLISFAGLLNRWANGKVMDMLKLLILGGIAVIACYVQPSFVSAMLLTSGFIVTTTIAILGKNFKGNKKKFLVALYGSACFSFILIILFLIRQGLRWYHLFPRLQHPAGRYVHQIALELLTGARFIGEANGLFVDNGFEKILRLPMANGDFVFVYIVAAFGWVTGILVLIVLLTTILRMLATAMKIKTTYGKFLSSSIVTVFALQIISNLLMNFGIFPNTGATIPFISFGGSSFIANMALVGFLLGIYRRKDMVLLVPSER
ncbi:FtsW/RodA/SpoVE family cell cycle protein [Alkaliphilus transvaalensis]|uniref:FtsW/RodA/SpoVE family cell cycle protein n=1 Tax=Alkaliphilus transvaalensis TaxID=114628 RepID=UPI000688ECE8|nr:FtsW/RodA/SpoVE family cell cycle protein [Alkaliphilus transvaalensis]